MDLAEIRKKARTQGQSAPAEAPSVDSSAAPSVESSGALPTQVEEDLFWGQGESGHFATEEEYTQGLIVSDEEDVAEQVQWLGFYLGAEEYAVELEVVSELIKPRTLTDLPQVPDYVSGIISLRGEVMPVIDLNRRLGLAGVNESDSELRRIIVCEGPEQRYGLLVDRVSQVVRLTAGEIESPQLVGDDPAGAFVQGIGRKQGKMLILLHPQQIMEIDAELG